MSIPLTDRGNYYRGLLILIRRDQTIDAEEREIMLRVGQALDFDKRFCESAIDDLFKNPHIKAEPIIFSDRKIATSFIHDAISLALADGILHPKELSWLKAVVHANGLNKKWLSAEIARLRAPKASRARSKAII
jgi:hypothetical protein